MEEKYEELGQIIYEIESLAIALLLNVPPQMHVDSLRSLLPEKVEKLKESFVSITGENPWE